MHAVVITVYVADPHDEMGRKNLRENVAPGVARAPGFVAGYWLEPTAGNEALSVVLFETEDFAKADWIWPRRCLPVQRRPQG